MHFLNSSIGENKRKCSNPKRGRLEKIYERERQRRGAGGDKQGVERETREVGGERDQDSQSATLVAYSLNLVEKKQTDRQDRKSSRERRKKVHFSLYDLRGKKKSTCVQERLHIFPFSSSTHSPATFPSTILQLKKHTFVSYFPSNPLHSLSIHFKTASRFFSTKYTSLSSIAYLCTFL